MKNYFKYYRVMSLMNLSRKGLLFITVFFFLHFIQYQVLFTEQNTTSFGPLFLLLISASIVYLFSYQAYIDVTNPKYQFPIAMKERVKYDFISIFVVTFYTLLFFMGLMLVFVILFYIFGDTSSGTEDDTLSGQALVYQVAHHLLVIASLFPLAYVKSNKKRYLIAGISFALMFVFNLAVLSIASAAMINTSVTTISFKNNITDMITHFPYVNGFVTVYALFSVLMLWVSYKKAIKWSAY